MGLHAAMDHTSPQHENFALWDIKYPLLHPFDISGHYNGEDLDMAKSGDYDASVLGAMYKYLNMESCSCEK
jgi:hypothetical protein